MALPGETLRQFLRRRGHGVGPGHGEPGLTEAEKIEIQMLRAVRPPDELPVYVPLGPTFSHLVVFELARLARPRPPPPLPTVRELAWQADIMRRLLFTAG